MALPASIASRLRLPAVCAPMFLVSGPELVAEACKAGLMGALPRHNARSFDEFAGWLKQIRAALERDEAETGRLAGPLAVNLPTLVSSEELAEHLALCRAHGVEVIINAQGDPTELAKRVHDWGGLIFHDVTTIRFAEKAIAANVDGMIAIGAGGGGHSGTLSPLVLIPKLRAMFGGTIVMAGAVANGAAIRAAETLGADLAYLGTRFIASQESLAPDAYKQMLIAEDATGLAYTRRVAGVAANWLTASMHLAGLDPAALPPAPLRKTHDHLPEGVTPWRNLWSAGQGIEMIADAPHVAEIVERLAAEYDAAFAVPRFPSG